MAQTAIVVDAEIQGGVPCFRGTRVPFASLIEYLAHGHPLDEFLEQFPTVDRDMAVRALREAGDALLARV